MSITTNSGAGDQSYIAAEPGQIFWTYGVPPDKGSKVQLLTIGGIQVSGRWYGNWGDAFMAWAPNIKRNKPLETQLWAARAAGIQPQWEAQAPEGGATVPKTVLEARRALRCLHLAVDEGIANDICAKVEAAFTELGCK